MAYHQITLFDRFLIGDYLWHGMSVNQVADRLQRHRSTIYRELARNQGRDGSYRFQQADSAAHTRKSNSRRNYRLTDQDWDFVERLLRDDWTPSRSPAGSTATTCCRSATRPSIDTSGPTSNEAASRARWRFTCVARVTSWGP